jgi:hypothetical protein
LVDKKIGEHQGRIVKIMGDGILAEFPSVVSAVACAAEIQQGMQARNASMSSNRRVEFRVCINLGDVIVEGDDIYGDGVNVAARLQTIAAPAGIAVTQSMHDQVGNRLNCAFEDCGYQQLKNIDKPVRRLQCPAGGSSSNRREVNERPAPSVAVLPFTNMEWRPRTGVFQRWDHRRHHHRLVESVRPVRHRAQHRVHLQGQGGEGRSGRPGTRGCLRSKAVCARRDNVRVTGELINANDGGHVGDATTGT